MPSRSACRSTNPVIWPRVAPAARSRPSSRARSTSVIESVLKMRNAPVNRAIAAMSAVVAWKSAVDERSEAARSAGEDRTYGSISRPAFERRRDRRRIRVIRERDVDASEGVLVEDGLRGPERDDRPSGPSVPTAGPCALQDPDDPIGGRRRRGPARSVRSRSRGRLRSASRRVIRALGSSALVRPKPSSRTMSWTCGSRGGSIPTTVTAAGKPVDGHGADTSGARRRVRRRATPSVDSIAAGACRDPVRSRRTRRRAGRPARRGRGRSARSTSRWRRSWPGRRRAPRRQGRRR